jgi:hypothetical protein
MMEASRRAVESLGDGGGRTELDSERLELLRAVSDSLAGAGPAALSGYGAQLTLLDHMGGYSPGLRTSRI